MELHAGIDDLRAEGIKLYAVSYDDVEALAAYVEGSGVDFPLLSDVDSRVIRDYGVLNTIVRPDDVPFYGIPFPGFFLLNEEGVIVDKLFNRHLAHREGIESILDSFAGRTRAGAHDPSETVTEDDGITVTAFVRGGGGVLRVGPMRRLVVRFELPDGIHIYDEPVPAGMVATEITVRGPEGVRTEDPEHPATELLELPGVPQPLHVWSGVVDIVIPLYADSSLKAEIGSTITLELQVRYQACDDAQCFLPITRTLGLEIPVAPSVLPAISGLKDDRADRVNMDSDHHIQRLIERKRRGRD